MKAQIQWAPVADNRRHIRHVAHRDGAVEPVGAVGLFGTVTNLSRSGCRVVIDETLMPESVVWITMGEHGPFMARVVWYDGKAAGCEFSGKLHPNLVDRLRQA